MEAQYTSTRNASENASAKEALIQGIAPDGGLFVWPGLESVHFDLDEICSGDYLSLAAKILKPLLSGFTQEEIEDSIREAYGNTFESEQITPLKKVGDIHVLELFHGPTCAFKDVALTLLPRLMSRALKSTGKKALILTATSGDTGKAALSGFQDVDNTAICVFYPDGKVSNMQYLQMATQKGDNVKVFGVKGNFDDAQSMVKKLFLDKDLEEQLAKDNIILSSANSINIGRLVPQIVYYFDAYRQLVESGQIQPGDKVAYSVPTGNFGDVLAGYYASLMGLPVGKFYVASNANNVLTDFLSTGTYDKNRPFIQTISPSMDILISSNLERLLYYASGKDEKKVAGWMEDLARDGKYTVDEKTLEKIQELFDCGSYDDDAVRKTIREVYEQTGYVLDPHSATAYELAKKEPGVVVSLSTASPYKFSSDVLKALGEEVNDDWKALEVLNEKSGTPIPAGILQLKEAEILHKEVLEPDQMKEAVIEAAGELFHD